MADGPSVWPGQARALFRNAHNNHLCAVSFDRATKQHRFRDYTCVRALPLRGDSTVHPSTHTHKRTHATITPHHPHPQQTRHDAGAPVVGAGAPLAVSRQEAVWVGDDGHLYRLALDTLALIDHSATTGLLARVPLRLMDRCKVFYASACNGQLVEESLQGGTQINWKVTDHTAEHGAPRVAAGGGVFEVVLQSARVLYRGAEDGRLWELWYCGEAWRLAWRDDEEGVAASSVAAEEPPLSPASAGPELQRGRGSGVTMTG